MKALDDSVKHAVDLVHEAASAKQAKDQVALDVRGLTTLTDVLYICHGDSGRSVEAISEAVVRRLRDGGVPVGHVEGLKQGQWVLIDLGSVMIHVFSRERRSHYNLERLWHDADPVELPRA